MRDGERPQVFLILLKHLLLVLFNVSLALAFAFNANKLRVHIRKLVAGGHSKRIGLFHVPHQFVVLYLLAAFAESAHRHGFYVDIGYGIAVVVNKKRQRHRLGIGVLGSNRKACRQQQCTQYGTFQKHSHKGNNCFLGITYRNRHFLCTFR